MRVDKRSAYHTRVDRAGEVLRPGTYILKARLAVRGGALDLSRPTGLQRNLGHLSPWVASFYTTLTRLPIRVGRKNGPAGLNCCAKVNLASVADAAGEIHCRGFPPLADKSRVGVVRSHGHLQTRTRQFDLPRTVGHRGVLPEPPRMGGRALPGQMARPGTS